MTFRNQASSNRRVGWLWVVGLAVVVSAGQLGQAADDDQQSASRPTYQLAYRFRANAFLHYDVSHESTITTQVNQASETAVNKSLTRKHVRVVSVDGSGSAELEPTIDHVQMTVQFDGNDPIEFDSSNPEKQPGQFSQILQTVGKPAARIRVDRFGNLLNVTRLKRTETGTGQSDSDTNGMDPIQNILLPFPQQPIAVGHQWEEDFSVPVSVDRKLKKEVRLSRRCKLESVEDGIAIISFKTVVLDPINNPGMRAQLIQRTPAGTARFDIESGTILEKESKLDRTEIGVIGAASSMRAIMTRNEKLVPPEQVANRGAAKVN